jgi:uncharacterized membrane protein
MESQYALPAPQELHASGSLGELECLAAGAAAAIVIGYGLSRRSLPGALLAVAASPLAYRAVAGRWPAPIARRADDGLDEVRGSLRADRGIHVRESVRIERPIGDVYAFWRRLENLPSFMAHLERVSELSDKRSHWVAKGPAGVPVEWDAEIINEVPNQVIGWRSLPESDVVTAGSVNFDAVRNGRSTQISVHLQYAPPAGRVGSVVAMLAGREPSQTIREDLRRLKQVLEAGEIACAKSEAREQVTR